MEYREVYIFDVCDGSCNLITAFSEKTRTELSRIILSYV